MMEARAEWMCQGEHRWVAFYGGDIRVCVSCGHEERVSFAYETKEVVLELALALNNSQYVIAKAMKLLQTKGMG